MSAINTIFFDLGGVCLTNGWDHEQRQQIAQQFNIDYESFDTRHRQVVDTLERGQISLEDYLNWTLFYQQRPFGVQDIVHAMQQLSAPFDDTLAIVKAMRDQHRYNLMTLNNESRELNEYRIQQFGLCDLFSVFFSSCYLGLLKPQPEHYRRALSMAQRAPDQCLFIDDRPMNVEVARILGMHTIQFTSATQLEAEFRDHGITF